MRFEKWQALGNDYLIVESGALPWELSAKHVERLCDPHFGPGADGVLLLSEPGDTLHVAELAIFNPDGSEAELSGNGAREAALYLRSRGWTDRDQFTIVTKAGVVRPRLLGEGRVEMEIGRASLTSPDFPSGDASGKGVVHSAGRDWTFQHVNVGNPQCVIAVGAELESLDPAAIGPAIEVSELFPNRTNVSFTRVEGPNVRARIFERGVGETLSSGTGACGAAVAAFVGGAPSPLTVRLDGGELTVAVTDDLDLTLTGKAEPVYAAELSTELLESLGTL